MAKTQVQQLTSAVVALNKNPQDSKAAQEVSSLAQQIAPLWAAAKKPEDMSAGRISSTSSWITVAAVDPVLAAQDGPTAAGPLMALTGVLDEPPKEWSLWDYFWNDDPIPSLSEVADAIGGLVKEGIDKVTPSGAGAGIMIAGGLVVAWLVLRKRR